MELVVKEQAQIQFQLVLNKLVLLFQALLSHRIKTLEVKELF